MSPKSPHYSRLLIAGGRRERFLATLALLMVLSLVWTISVAFSFAAVGFAQAHLSQSSEMAHNLKDPFDEPMTIRLAVFVAALYPVQALIGETLFTWSLRRFIVGLAFWLLVCSPMIFARGWLNHMPLVGVPLAFMVSWSICAYVLHRTIMQIDLVPPKSDNANVSWLQTRRRMRGLRERL